MQAPARFLFVNLLLAVLTAASLAAGIFGKEVWPICAYAMFSRVREPDRLTRLRVYGVEADGSGREMALVEREHLSPFDSSRLQRALTRMEGRPDRDKLFREALFDLGARYERMRRAGRNRGPALRALRLYRVTWRLDPQARNVDRPEERLLLAEAAVPDV